MPEFWQTVGQHFIERTAPDLVRAIDRLATATEASNALAARTADPEPAKVICPWCQQAISYGQVGTECGGDGNGICTGAAYAFDLLAAITPSGLVEPRWEADGHPPDTQAMIAIIHAHEEARKRAEKKSK